MDIKSASSKRVFVFDLDGTLTKSKSSIEEPVISVLRQLLRKRKVAVISGSTYSQFIDKLVKPIKANPDELSNLYLFPTSGTQMYRYDSSNHDFSQVYSHDLTEDEKRVITLALEAAVKASGVKITGEVYGKQIEDRGSQITFSALGQSAPADKKYKWDPKHEKRRSILAKIDEHLGGRFEAKIGGTTSIDVTRKGQDKAYGIAMICENLRVTVSDIIFIGDALFEGGNDYEVKKTGVQTVQVGNPNDTASFIKSILSEMA
jgi:HAD superfamily hydrolase (TIGR01484 family)